MWLSTFFLCLFSISQWIPFAVAIMDDDIINYLEGHVRNWRGIYCAFCLQVVEHPGTDLPFDDATTGMIKEEIATVKERVGDPMRTFTIWAQAQMMLSFRQVLQVESDALEDRDKLPTHWLMQEKIVRELDLVIENLECTDYDRVRPVGDLAPTPNSPVDNSRTERRRKGTLRRGKRVGISSKQLKGKKGSARMSMSTEDVVRQGASPNIANFPSLRHNLWSRMSSPARPHDQVFPIPRRR